MIVDVKEYPEASVKKPTKFTEPELNVTNPRLEVHVSSLALQVEKLDIKNILDDIVKAKNQDEKATNDNYEVDGGNKKPALNGAPEFNSIKEVEAHNLVSIALMLDHGVARLNIVKRFPRFLWRPGDPCYPSYSVLKKIFTQLMSIPRVLYRGVLLVNTAIPLVFEECCVFTIVVLNMLCTVVNKQEELVAKNTQMSEYEEFTTKLKEKVNKEVVVDNEEVVKKHCEDCCCSPKFILNEHGKIAGTLDVYVKLSKEFLFPDLLRWTEPGTSWKITRCRCLTTCPWSKTSWCLSCLPLTRTRTRTGTMLRRTSSYSLPRLTFQTPCQLSCKTC